MSGIETIVGAEKKEKRELEWKYWIAVNKCSVSSSALPLPAYPTVEPTPQLLIGFDNREEQLECQQFLLNGRLDKVHRFVGTTLPRLAREGKVVLKKLRFPEKPSYGQTRWSYEGGEE